MNDQYADLKGAITTADSNADGRLKVDACSHGKKKCLKCAIKKSKSDGKGGPGYPKIKFPLGSGAFGSKKIESSLPPSPKSNQTVKTKRTTIPSKLKAKKGKSPKIPKPSKFKTPRFKKIKAEQLKKIIKNKK